MKEINRMRNIMLGVSKLGKKIFRNNVGKCWIGRSTVIKKRTTMALEPGDVVVRQARRFNAGLCKGSSDLIGWEKIIITEEMVGQSIARFIALEVKGSAGAETEDQSLFLSAVRADGGVGAVVRSLEDALDSLYIQNDPATKA